MADDLDRVLEDYEEEIEAIDNNAIPEVRDEELEALENEMNNSYGGFPHRVTAKKAADAAYLAWESEGEVTPEELAEMSARSEYENVSSLTTTEAEHALEAMNQYGIVEVEPGYDVDEVIDLAVKEADLEQEEKLDYQMDVDIFYETGPENGFAYNSESDPLGLQEFGLSAEQAFRKIGKMQKGEIFL